MDNNFNSMPKIVAEGRRVINNIKNSSSLYLMKTLFTAILAALCIFMSEPYLFMPSNVLLLEVCVIGVPSFFLSLQPNNARVQGKFITHVMSRALAGGLLMIICVMTLYTVGTVASAEFGQYRQAMCMLYRVCQPFNAYRLVLFLSMLAIAVICVTVPQLAELLYAGWGELDWDYAKALVIVVVIEAAFPLSSALIKIMEIVMPSSTGSGKKPAQKPAQAR